MIPLLAIGLGLILTAIVLLVIIILIFFYFSIYNSLVALKNNIDKSWSNIDVLLVQRNAELTKLLDSVKGYMKHEKTLLTDITKLRASVANAQGPAAKGAASDLLSGMLGKLFAVAENYPQLRASENFQQLQNRISELENSIADRREFYNDSVNTYNIRIQQIPDSIVAGMLNYTKKEMFKPAEGTTEDVKLKFE